MAAISGSSTALQWISKCLDTTENKKNAFDAIGIDGMSPLHLATKSGHTKLVAKIIRKKRLRTTTGLGRWGRAAIHLAASHGYVGITTLLLSEDAQIDVLDETGRTPLHYLVKITGELQDIDHVRDVPDNDNNENVDGKSSDKETEDAESDSENPAGAEVQIASAERRELVSQKRDIFVEFAKKSLKSTTDDEKSGRTYLHHAIEYTNIGTIEKLLSIGFGLETKDSLGHSALLFAIYSGRRTIALKLLEGFPDLFPSLCGDRMLSLNGNPAMVRYYGVVQRTCSATLNRRDWRRGSRHVCHGGSDSRQMR